MFTAKNKQTPDDSGSTQGSVSTVGGFGKVLNSIQGLQQRLGDFSIDQVTAAESNANTLIYRITVVQKKLQDLASLKRRLTSATETICQIPEIDFDLIGPDSLERHPQLHAIVKASKIIRLHKLLKVAKASAESVSFDSQIGRLEIGTPLAPVVAPTAAEKFPERSSKISSEAQSAKKPLAWPTDTGELGVIELPPPPPINNENSSHKVELVADIEPQITVSHDAASLPAQTESIVNEVSLAPTHTSPENSAATFEMSSEPAGAAVTAEAIRTPEVKVPSLEDGFKITLAMEPAEPVMQTSTPTESPPPKSETFAFNSAPEFEDERSPAPTDSVFNQRLLDDLIQNYGEFVIAPKSSPKPAPVEVESPISPEPKFVQSE
ncbi:MAG TPA: hypothetical protein VMT22_18695, partial [Terriglobales bacterium]|nr:hypothetical protein [Terriglobales bacterium]